MGGGTIQLVAIGVQNMFLTGDPQITFFKIVYKRHTNFSMETIPQFFTNRLTFGKRATVVLSRVGDLVGKIYLRIDLPAIPKYLNGNVQFAWVRKIGYALISYIDIEIGGKLIDRHYGEWLNIWDELTIPYSKKTDILIGNVPQLYNPSDSKKAYQLFVPLQFWFNRHDGLALPLVALHYSEVKINVELNSLDRVSIISPSHSILITDDFVYMTPQEFITQDQGNGVIAVGQYSRFDMIEKKFYFLRASNTRFLTGFPITGVTSRASVTPQTGVTERLNTDVRAYQTQLAGLNLKVAQLLVENIYLDNAERSRFLRHPIEYLIEQVQFSSNRAVSNSNQSLRINFNQPTKEIFWVIQLDSIVNSLLQDYFNYTNSIIREDCKLIGNNLMQIGTILINGLERLRERDGSYYNWVQAYQHHTHAPNNGINMYSFALYPELYQPSGSINLSRIDYLAIQMTLDRIITANNPGKVRIYSHRYNVLRIVNGFAGVVFAD